MNLSASSGATRSGLFVFCDRSHCCSSAATAFSVPPSAFLSCDHAALPTDSKLIKHHIQVLFIIEISLCVELCETVGLWSQGPTRGHCRLLRGACQKKGSADHSFEVAIRSQIGSQKKCVFFPSFFVRSL